MKEVTIPWHNQRRGVDHAIAISAWCRECGLMMNRDYEWYFDKVSRTTIFQFFGDSESYASICVLKWVN